jgi:hypothetical protein
MKADHGDPTGCSAMALRKATRRVPQLYDDMLKPAGLTITQFGQGQMNETSVFTNASLRARAWHAKRAQIAAEIGN